MHSLTDVVRFTLVTAGALVLIACGTVTPPATNPDAPSQPAIEDTQTPADQSQADPVAAKPAPEAEIPTDLKPDMLYRLLTAEIAGQRGHIDLAVKQYLAAAKESRDPEVVERATRIAVYARDDASAREAAELWTQLQPQSIDAHQVAAAMYVRAGDTKKAHAHLEQVIANSQRGDRHTFMLITSLLSKEKDKKVAMQVMEELTATRQDNPEALYAYAQLALVVGELDKASVAAERVRTLLPEEADTHILHSNILYRQGRKTQAMDDLKAAVDRYPNNISLRDYYARRLVDEKRYPEARQQFNTLLEAAPDNYEAEYALALLSMQLHDLDGAEQHFKNLVKSGKRLNEASYYLGQLAEQQNKEETAIQWYQVVNGGQYQIDAQIRIALIEARMGKIERARTRLQEIQVDSAEVEQRLYLAEGEILREAKMHQEAFDLYNVALAKMPESISLLYARALAAEKIDRIDVTFVDLKKIIEIEPNNVQALNAYGYTMVDRTDKIKEGYEYIQRAYKLQPEDPAILDSMGWANYRMRNYPEALKYLRKALELLKDAEIAAHLGEVLWVSGDHDQARTVWDAARRETPSHKLLLDVIKRFTE